LISLSRIGSTLAAFAFVVTAATAVAQTPAPQATLSPVPQGTEVAFVQSVSKDLNARFPTPADAVKAGYFQYTLEDRDGAVNYVNLKWSSGNPAQPSQLWYDVKGQLIGADWSVLQSQSLAPPALWGVNYHRWTSFREHVHFVLAGPNGTELYGATSAKKFVAAGGNADDPQPATLVKMGIAKSVDDVKHVFLFPSIWDLAVWVKPNPDGAFAEKNPLYPPQHPASSD
jgi:hypothetical protein